MRCQTVSVCFRGLRVRVSGGHLCEAEAPTEPTGETFLTSKNVNSAQAGFIIFVEVGTTRHCLPRLSEISDNQEHPEYLLAKII